MSATWGGASVPPVCNLSLNASTGYVGYRVVETYKYGKSTSNDFKPSAPGTGSRMNPALASVRQGGSAGAMPSGHVHYESSPTRPTVESFMSELDSSQRANVARYVETNLVCTCLGICIHLECQMRSLQKRCATRRTACVNIEEGHVCARARDVHAMRQGNVCTLSEHLTATLETDCLVM